MTQDEFITLAHEAGFQTMESKGPYSEGKVFVQPFGWYCNEELERFAALVAAKERERIALEFDRRAEPESGFYEPEEPAEIVRGMGEP